MKLTKAMVTVLVGLALVLTIPALAQMAGQGASEKGCAIPNLTPDQAAKMAKVGADIQKKCLAHRNAVGSLLTDEQKKALEQKCGGMSCGTGMGHGADCGSACGAHKMGKMGKEGQGAKGCAKGCGSTAGCEKVKK